MIRTASSVIAAAIALVINQVASAADMPVRAPAPVAAPSWTGFYLGVHAGWAWTSNASATSAATAAGAAVAVPQTTPLDTDSPIAGLQLGYNYQFSNWVVGVEGDISGARLNAKQTALTTSGGGFVACGAGTSCGNVTLTQDIQWLASARGRVGYAWGPALIYLTGGGAWADVNYSGNMIQSLVVGPPSNFATTVSQIRSGSVVGAGYEWMITANWTLRGEFLHYWFNTTAAASATNPTGPSTAAFSWSRFDVSVARVAVNYKF